MGAGALQKGHHITQNRELKVMIKRFKEQIEQKQEIITKLTEDCKVYKKRADQTERLQMKIDEITKLNSNLKAHSVRDRAENEKLRKKVKLHKTQSLCSQSMGNLDLDGSIGSYHGILSPPNGSNHNNEIAVPLDSKSNILAPDPLHGDMNNIQPLQIEENESNENKEELEVRKPSKYVKNQRLMQLTGDQTYM